MLEQNEGFIRVKKVGLLDSEELWATRDRICRWRDELLIDPNSVNESEVLWIIDQSKVPREWRLRDDIGLRLESEELDDSPLELPQWDWG